MKVLYWNVYIAHHPEAVVKELHEMIRANEPHVIGLGEASRMGPYMDLFPGYRAYWLKETYRGRGDTIALVRNDVKPRLWYWKRFTKWWTGPKHGWPQGPKRFWSGRIKFNDTGTVYRISIGHWPFNTAVPEVRAWVTAWFKRSSKPSAHIGDLNTSPAGLTEFVKGFNGKHEGIGIDRALYKNCSVTARSLGNHGSDHPAVLFNIGK